MRRYSRNALTRVALASCACATLVGLPLTSVAKDWIYTVRPRDNPWNLTERYLKGLQYWPKLQQLNHITDPCTFRRGPSYASLSPGSARSLRWPR